VIAQPSADPSPAPARRGRRSGRRDTAATFAQPAFRQPRRFFPPVEIISADELEAIHLASLQVLEEIGMDFLDEEARQILAAAGAEVSPGSTRVRLDRGLVLQAIRTAPAEFTLHARNAERHVRFGGNWLVNALVAGSPNCSDLDRGRRPGTREDFRELVKLGQTFNILHLSGGYPVEPIDLHPRSRHLDATLDLIRLTDKGFPVYSLGPQRNRDVIEMVRIARGISREQLEREPSLSSTINSSSPLRLDTPMLQGIIEMSRANQIIVMTPFTLAGAMAPVTLAGALVEQNAEALAGMALTQLVRPGAPVIYGGFTSNVDMKSGAPAFGTPEYMKATLIGGQLARRYNVPYRSSNTCAANTVDAQAAYESIFSLWAVVMGGCHFVKHAAGWMEGGLTCSYEKTVIDVDTLQMVAEFLEPLEVSEATLGLDAMREVGPGGHFFGAAHTQARYRDAFYAPIVSDWRNYESWREAGGPDAMRRAHRIWKDLLASYEPPPLDPAIDEELEAFVARRMEEGGVRTDF
jgi:trimethylamine--corrinoid protein Co-methyltransferase